MSTNAERAIERMRLAQEAANAGNFAAAEAYSAAAAQQAARAPATVQQAVYNHTVQIMQAASRPAPTPEPPSNTGTPSGGGGGGGNDAADAARRAAEAAAAAAREAEAATRRALEEARQAQRNNIFDTVAATLKQYGIDADGNGLAALVRQWAQEDKSAAWITVNLRDTQQYKQRFPAMQKLIERKMAIDEATYIAQERAYNAVLKAADLPAGFYDGPEDYASLITGQVSAKELQDRIDSAKTFMDANTDPSYKAKLTQYFGISDGQMLAYVLDGERAQSIINKQIKTAAMGGAAARAGFDLDSNQAGRYAGTLGQEYDAFGTDDRTRLDTALSALGVEADTQQRLAQIDQDNAFARTDVLDAGLLGDANQKLASQTRRNREVGRFTGTSAIGRGSLSRNTGV